MEVLQILFSLTVFFVAVYNPVSEYFMELLQIMFSLTVFFVAVYNAVSEYFMEALQILEGHLQKEVTAVELEQKVSNKKNCWREFIQRLV